MNHGLHMIKSLTLHVHCQGHPVGRLEFEPKANAFSFSYDPAWEKQPDSFVLSPHISFEAQANSLVVKRFLENLLPEGRALDIVAHTHQVSKNNVYALIHELGKEPVGALSFSPDIANPAQYVALVPLRRPISNKELSSRIRDRGQPYIACRWVTRFNPLCLQVRSSSENAEPNIRHVFLFLWLNLT